MHTKSGIIYICKVFLLLNILEDIDMATNLAIDNNLLVSAKKIGKIKTKKETVNSALKEFIEKRKQEGIIDLFNSIEYDEKYNYKIMRNR